MQIQPATCPACGAVYDPLRAQAVTVIDGRVRAFCSATCRERGIAPPAPARAVTDAHAAIPLPPRPRLPTELKVVVAAASTTLAVFVALIAVGRHTKVRAAPATKSSERTAAAPASKVDAKMDSAGADAWIQPVAAGSRRAVVHDRRLFFGREGLPAGECGGGRCAIEVDTAAGAVVMAVHDGVIEAVERDPGGGEEGRFIRIIHKGGAIASSYLQLDGIREDLRPGIPVKAGEPIGTVARAPNASARAHFRFAISVRGAADGGVLFLDPQPLLALWPIRRDAPMSLHAMERAPGPASITDERAAKRVSRQIDASDSTQ